MAARTLREQYLQGVRRLRDAGMEDADSAVRILLEDGFGVPYVRCLTEPERRMEAEDSCRFERAVERLAHHEPLAYLLGKTEFMGLPFQVNPSVLIPRQDTERLVEWVLEDIGPEAERIADIGTGSGCIAESLLYYNKKLRAAATDNSPAALEVARQNARLLGVSDRAAFYQGDLFEALETEPRFDRIVSNPPYIDREAMRRLPETVRFEPEEALFGGEDGLDFYRRIAKDAPSHLKPGGTLYFEIGYDQGQSVPSLLDALHYKNIRVRRDYAGHDRVVRCETGS